MSVRKPAQMARILKRNPKRTLVLAGALCDEVDFGGRKLLDYAAEIAQKLELPVAATGNTVLGFKAKGVASFKKAWAGEMVDLLRGPCLEPLTKEKPELVVLIGYSPAVAGGLATAITEAETVSLGSSYVSEATYSLAESASFVEWQARLSELVEAIQK